MKNKRNNIEVEIKFLLSDKEASRLEKIVSDLTGTKARGRLYERTVMFDDDHGRMRGEDARLRVRQIGDSDTVSDIEFAYKRRLKADGPIKKEEEIEIAFSADPDRFIEILGKMGYGMTTSYERYRTTYMNKSLKITFDEFPFGSILEIEGAESKIRALCAQLALDIERSTLESCDDVYDRLCRERGIVVRDHIEFSDRTMPHLS
jgi:adenylate cyclase class IV